jgi:thiol-disulfide isomerase/thioredoxin
MSKMIRTAGWALFVAASLAIHYEVKYGMRQPATGTVDKIGNLATGQMAPDFTLRDLSDHSVPLSSFRGHKVVLIDFWALWCGPCRMAMPGLQGLADKSKDGNLEILSVNQGDAADEVRRFMGVKKYTFHVVLDSDQAVGNLYGVGAIPTLVVVDKKGVVRLLSVGYSENDDTLRDRVEKLTKE